MGATLQFKGTDFRDLVVTLAEAFKLAEAGERPSVEVNAIIYAADDLGAIAALMPDAALLPKHQAIVDAVLIGRPKPTGYRKAAAVLARRVGV